jgi:hypothetical protein
LAAFVHAMSAFFSSPSYSHLLSSCTYPPVCSAARCESSVSVSAIGVYVERCFCHATGTGYNESFMVDDHCTLEACRASAIAIATIADGEATFTTLHEIV